VKLYRERLSKSKVIMVSHNVAEIKEWCDKIIYMKNGQITVYDDIDEGIAVYQGKA
ncbi:ABC transporter ATP-binding protein, partial [Campylobacter jejuni]|nr:ABC transporter ATP-binding protein [Campylobacter jejuni]